ncbi:HNH endonuclease signature motif containing protein [Pseudomonas sp. FP1740]|uniref:HNH endonuclease signature motif containing protein n=1 Tax=Pseudomonas sp. FP1740 TaxID=2954078 RepID=UPI0027369C48|nr:HNH endonuclease signature motif containing protein [Pseudomonas sp. FP1740]WLG43284.1 HNH endonuclease signature motif containing protein [Pseudomonas sp. FP1740]
MNPIAQQAFDRALARLSREPEQRTKDRKPWSPDDEARLCALYPDTPMPELIQAFQRPYWSIYNKAYLLGLKRSEAYLASEHACRLRRENNPGTGTRFQKGQTSWNKGLSYTAGGRSAETRFKVGTVNGKAALLLQPIGTERVTKDGIRQRKVRDDGPPQRRWKSVHMILWEESNGTVPPGHIVVFRDKNTAHIDIDNLELITRAENMRRNTIHRYPSELKSTIRQLGKLKKAISEASNEKQDD